MGNKAGFDDEAIIDVSSLELDNLVSAPDTPDSNHGKIYIKDHHAYRINYLGEERNLELTGDSVDEIGGLMFSFTDQTAAGIEVQNTTYRLIGRFFFAGTDKLGVMSKIKIMAHRCSGSNDYSLKVYDVINGNQIVEKTGLTNDDYQVIDLGTLSNLPSGESVFELWGKVGTGTKACVDGGVTQR